MLTQRPLRFVGVCASPGLARGPLHVVAEDNLSSTRTPGGAKPEAAALGAALRAAMRELGALNRRCAAGDARTLLEFQIAMLEDDTIGLAAFIRIEQGERADSAWRLTLDTHIEDYRTSKDAYFAARAADLQDLRDRVLRCLAGHQQVAIPPGIVLVARDLAPSRFLEIDWKRGGGIALTAGNAHSHVAILARARGVPMLVELAPVAPLPAGYALLDAQEGTLIAGPDRAAVRAFRSRRGSLQRQQRSDATFLPRPAMTANGERVQVLLNVAHIEDLRGISAGHCDGVGLVRTELTLRTADEIRDEELQFRRYSAIVEWAGELPVTFRTLDAGGDKPIEGYSLKNEVNPFSGVRGIRLSLLHPELMSIQLRALARVSAVGNVNVMLPLVTVSAEFERARTMLQAVVAELRSTGIPCRLPPLGIMVETPAAALTLDTFDADFFSIGSNDLIAYLACVSRDCVRLTELVDPLGPAVLRLIRKIIEHARDAQRPLSLCGDMAADPRSLRALLHAGLRSISIAPAQLGRVKSAIAAGERAND